MNPIEAAKKVIAEYEAYDVPDDDGFVHDLFEVLAEWQGQHYDEDDDLNFYDRKDLDRIDELRSKVTPYKHDVTLPELPCKPDGQLFGIGFIYDEDKDDRVLVAIQKIIDHLKEAEEFGKLNNIVALAEHEGQLELYTRKPYWWLDDLNVAGDVWSVTEVIPFQGQWRDNDDNLKNECVAAMMNAKKRSS